MPLLADTPKYLACSPKVKAGGWVLSTCLLQASMTIVVSSLALITDTVQQCHCARKWSDSQLRIMHRVFVYHAVRFCQRSRSSMIWFVN